MVDKAESAVSYEDLAALEDEFNDVDTEISLSHSTAVAERIAEPWYRSAQAVHH